MPSYYSVFQYLPDPVAGERINFGVIVFGEKGVKSRFLVDWRRVRCFADGRVDFLQEFVKDWQRTSSPQNKLPGLPWKVTIDEKYIRETVASWGGSIQITEPRGSLAKNEDELLNTLTQRFLKEPGHTRRAFRTRSTAASIAYRGLDAVVRDKLGDASEGVLKRDHEVKGKLERHQLDVCLTVDGVNTIDIPEGYVACAHALSFEGPDSRERHDQTSLSYFAFEDIRREYPGLPLGMLVLPPKGKSKDYDRASWLFKGLNAEIIVEEAYPEWARYVSDMIPKFIVSDIAHRQAV